ncbi:hypothetical protein JB92DRAFT_2827760 [Gautieria morchelliformis]|nr:hypothetical protein JB92DRAFT_2827760 [Gautieria morchelliformis]
MLVFTSSQAVSAASTYAKSHTPSDTATRNPASDEEPGIIPQTPPRDDTADEESGEIVQTPPHKPKRRHELSRIAAAKPSERPGTPPTRSRHILRARVYLAACLRFGHAWDDNDGRGDYGKGLDCGRAAGCGSTADCVNARRDEEQSKEAAAGPRDGRGERQMTGGGVGAIRADVGNTLHHKARNARCHPSTETGIHISTPPSYSSSGMKIEPYFDSSASRITLPIEPQFAPTKPGVTPKGREQLVVILVPP